MCSGRKLAVSCLMDTLSVVLKQNDGWRSRQFTLEIFQNEQISLTYRSEGKVFFQPAVQQRVATGGEGTLTFND